MPYIKQEKRNAMKSSMGDLAAQIESVGELNYAFFKLACLFLKKVGVCYKNLNELIGVYESSKLEFYRRKVVPYEDVKIIENGDVI